MNKLVDFTDIGIYLSYETSITTMMTRFARFFNNVGTDKKDCDDGQVDFKDFFLIMMKLFYVMKENMIFKWN